MKQEEAKVGMRVYATDTGEEGTIVSIYLGDYPGCDVEFDNGYITWVADEEIEELKEETK